MSAHFFQIGIFVNLSNAINSAAVQIKETRQITGMSDIHRVGNACAGGRNLIVFSCRHENRKLVIFIGGHDQFGDRQTHAAGVFTAQRVTEISRRNGKNCLFFVLGKLGIGVNVVDDLRENPTEVDGIGRGQVKFSFRGSEKALLTRILAMHRICRQRSTPARFGRLCRAAFSACH